MLELCQTRAQVGQGRREAMAKPTYWLDLFSWTTWQEFLEGGAKVSGFRDRRWKTVQAIRPGDFLLCYLTGISRFIGLLGVVSEPFRDTSKIWKDEDFPCRVKVKATIALTPETAVPVHELRGATCRSWKNLKSPHAWTGHFRGSPARWKSQDALVIVKALEAAKVTPVVRWVDPAKLGRRPRALTAKIGLVSVPGAEDKDRRRLSLRPPLTLRFRLSFCGLAATWDSTCGSRAMIEVGSGVVINSGSYRASKLSCHFSSTRRRPRP